LFNSMTNTPCLVQTSVDQTVPVEGCESAISTHHASHSRRIFSFYLSEMIAFALPRADSWLAQRLDKAANESSPQISNILFWFSA
jgi:hypothetical protein